ncbi:MAG: DUF1990 family protein [Pyrinomonadaceae bacterium]
MFLLTEPTSEKIQQFLNAQKDKPFSYTEVGSSRRSIASLGYIVDHNREKLGRGREVFERAVRAIQNWKMFDFDWLQLCWEDTPIEVGSTVGLLINHFGFWSLNAARIVYILNESSATIERYGFAYGTLPEHAERGEERFSVEYNKSDESVWYDLYAFSQPNNYLAKIGYPFSRMLQKKFAADSKAAMMRAVKG